ncbi:hypothetical protein HMPREF0541_01937 [Lacticaseibacillus rhamnosus ATCC 21052]|nr:hypothetical protein HMPREF0541_01937 [Lacticaseibacillus rhamnosus ATCC 21052]
MAIATKVLTCRSLRRGARYGKLSAGERVMTSVSRRLINHHVNRTVIAIWQTRRNDFG